MESPPPSGAGRQVGGWRLVGEIGRGGTGVVWRAERAGGGFAQQAALKLIRRGLDSEETVARFLRERQILARLQHPHIARLLDGGVSADAQPWFAMELVAGRPITDHCEERRAGLEERLRLFLDACDAVAYAHRNLVVHRDLKPSNILVTADGQVRLVDFGIARLLASEAEDGAMGTRTGQPLGTPAYAAPEQIRGQPATTATDVYGLGMVLYELLAGRRPYDVDGLAPVQAARVALHTQPVPPSRSSGRRGAGRLRGDLDTIVLMALRKEPERRYATVEGLARDIVRFRQGLPVAARPDTAAYRARKFMARHRTAVAASLLALLSLVAGLASTAHQAGAARREAEKAREIRAFLVSLFEMSDPSRSRGELVTAREILDRGARRIDRDLAGQPALQAEIMLLIGGLSRDLGLYEQAGPLLSRAAALIKDLHGPRSRDHAVALHNLAEHLLYTGEYEKARRVFGEARRVFREAGAGGDPAAADAADGLATVLNELGEFDEALRLRREALDIDRRHYGAEHPSVAHDLGSLGATLVRAGRSDEGERTLREALAMQRRLLPPDDAEIAATATHLSGPLLDAGRYDEAQQLLVEAVRIRRKVLGDAHSDVADSLSSLAILHESRGDFPTALRLAREAVDIDRRAVGESHPHFAVRLNNHAVTCYRLGAYDEAEASFRQVIGIWGSSLGPDHPNLAAAYNNLGMTQREKGDLPAAEANVSRALARRRAIWGDEHESVAQSLRNLGLIGTDRGELEAAEAAFSESLALSRRVYAPGHLRLAEVLAGFGRLRLEQGRPAEAEPLLRESLSIRREKTGDQSLPAAESKMYLGACLAALGRRGDAESLLREALEISVREAGEDDARSVEAELRLGLLLAGAGHGGEARNRLDSGVRRLSGREGWRTGLAREARRALHRLAQSPPG